MHVISNLNDGGAEGALYRLCVNLPNHKHIVVSMLDEGKYGPLLKDAGISLHCLRMSRGKATITGVWRLWKLLRDYRPDVVQTWMYHADLLGGLAARIAGCRRVVNAVVGGGYAFTSQGLLARLLRPLLSMGLTMSLNPKGSRVVFENADDRNGFVKAGWVRQQDSVLIRGAGVDPDQFQLTSKAVGPPLVVLVARMLWDKGVGEFVVAARTLKQRGVNARFVLVGDVDPDNRACIDSATLGAWKAEGEVELWGFRADIPQVLAQATIACLPSYREGLPKSLLEAMAAGLPCVTTDVPGCREAVRHGDNGLLVPAKDASALADAIAHLLKHPELARQMGCRGRQLLEQEFSAQRVNTSTLALYHEMLSA
jgi:glycosyltransferase involved in cell wall biosynthesis